MFKKILATGALVAATILAAPIAANAAGGYGTPGGSTDTLTGSDVAVSIDAGWAPDTTTASVSAEGPAVGTITPAATTTGTANVRAGVVYFTFTPSVPGVYTFDIEATNGTSSGQTAAFTINATDPLAGTGINDPAPTLWIAGGLVVVGIALIATFVAVRRQNAKLGADA